MSVTIFAPSLVHVASFTWFVYDYSLNLSDEIAFVWSHNHGWTKYAYASTKLAGIAALSTGLVTVYTSGLSGQTCQATSILMGVCGFVVTAFADILLILRVHFMFECRTRYLVFNFVLYALIVIGAVTVNIVHFPDADAFFSIAGVQGSCYMHPPRFLSLSWLLGLAFQIYLSIWAVVNVRRARRSLVALGRANPSVLVLLVQGNLQYFFLIVAAYCATTALVLCTHMDQGGAYNMLTLAAMGIFGPKLLRDMRRQLFAHDAPISASVGNVAFTLALPLTDDTCTFSNHAIAV